jgi:CMP-N-acetylneuraminic acid synthetase
MKEKILAVIPARGSKDEVEHMNIRELGGRPLIYYTIKAALESKKINRVIVSTEDETVAKIAMDYGAEVPFLRPIELSNKDINLAEVISKTLEKLHDIEDYNCNIVVELLPNTPFKKAEDIDKMIDLLNEEDFDSVIPLCQMKEFVWKPDGQTITPDNFEHRNKRADTNPLLVEKGGIYVNKKEVFDPPRKPTNLGEKIGYYTIGNHSSLTIHTVFDFFILERLIKLPVDLIETIMEHE